MAAKFRLHTFRLPLAAMVAAGALSLSGCGNFFVCEKASCTNSSGSTGTGSGDYAYVSNSASGSTKIEGYSVAAGTLASLTGFPFDIGYTPSAMTITPANTYLYVAKSGTGLIYGFSISSAGALTSLSNGSALASQITATVSMDVSPDGKFLYSLDSTGQILSQYAITTSTGLLGNPKTFSITSTGTITPQMVKVSPNGNFLVCALGTGGTVVFPYNSSAGIPLQAFASITTNAVAVGDYGVAIDTNNNLYIARTTGPIVYSVTTPTSTSVTATPVTQPTLTAGAGPHSIVLGTSSGTYAYVGNTTGGTVSGYTSTSAGVLADMSGSPFAAPSSVLALGRDNSGKYILAAGYNSSTGIQLYTIGSSGALTAAASAASGTSGTVPVMLALTH